MTLLLVLLLSAAVSAGVVYIWLSGRISRLREKNSRLETELELQTRAVDEQKAAGEALDRQLRETFNALASDALKDNNAQFLRLARESLERFHVKADGDLEKREKAVEGLVKPIREALEKTEKQLQSMEKDRHAAHGALTKHLETMAESHRLLQSETRNLVQALRRPEVRGQWGELTLKRLAELAGMVEHCDFTEQNSVQGEQGKLRPDMVIRMPDRREIVVDAKTPLDAYLSAIEAGSDTERRSFLEQHARNVRARIRELSNKAYWEQFDFSPEFVVLFIPGDQFLSAALEVENNLIEDALAQQVILATPTSFVALLRAVAFGWRQEQLQENAEKIRTLGQDMYGRMATFAGHLAKLGRSLDSSVSDYNKAVGSYDTRILPAARKFTEMGIAGKRDLPQPDQVERATRTLENSEEEAPVDPKDTH